MLFRSYSQNNLNKFNRTLRYSRLVNDIDNADPSIVSNETDIQLIKYTQPVLNIPQNIILEFKSELAQNIPELADEHPISDLHTLSSTNFVYNGQRNCRLEDDGNGKVNVVFPSGTNHIVVDEVGTVNYNTGIVKISNFTITNFTGRFLKVYATPKFKDVSSSQNVILNIVEPDINVSIQQIRE